jgi:hypothetical protein
MPIYPNIQPICDYLARIVAKHNWVHPGTQRATGLEKINRTVYWTLSCGTKARDPLELSIYLRIDPHYSKPVYLVTVFEVRCGRFTAMPVSELLKHKGKRLATLNVPKGDIFIEDTSSCIEIRSGEDMQNLIESYDALATDLEYRPIFRL